MTPTPTQAQNHHDHDHSHGIRGGSRRAMVQAFLLTTGFMVAEFVGGLWSNSLALVADATHMLSDSAALGLGLVAMYVATRPHTGERSFGWHRVEILAALLNGASLLALSGVVIWHAVERFRHAQVIDDGVMLIIAVGGLAVNLLAIRLLGHHSDQNLNIRGAYLHVLGDALGSGGAIAAALCIRWTGWTPVDSLASGFIALLVAYGGWRLARETVSVLLESAPPHLDVSSVQDALTEIEGVSGIHDFHLWTVTSGFVSLSCHLELAPDADSDEILRLGSQMLRERFAIHHVTIQPESGPVHVELEHCCDSEHPAASSFSQFLLGR